MSVPFNNGGLAMVNQGTLAVSGGGSALGFMGLPAVPWIGAALLTAAVLPFAAPMVRFTAFSRRPD